MIEVYRYDPSIPVGRKHRRHDLSTKVIDMIHVTSTYRRMGYLGKGGEQDMTRLGQLFHGVLVLGSGFWVLGSGFRVFREAMKNGMMCFYDFYFLTTVTIILWMGSRGINIPNGTAKTLAPKQAGVYDFGIT